MRLNKPEKMCHTLKNLLEETQIKNPRRTQAGRHSLQVAEQKPTWTGGAEDGERAEIQLRFLP